MDQDSNSIHVQRIVSSNDVLLRDFAQLLHQQTGTESIEESLNGIHQSLQLFDFLGAESNYGGEKDKNVSSREKLRQSHFFIAHVGDAPAGYIAVQRIPKADARGGFYFVDELFVSENFRRRGVGRRLLNRVQSLLCEVGDAAGVRLLVRCENDRAQQLYRNEGFVLSETLFGQYYPVTQQKLQQQEQQTANTE